MKGKAVKYVLLMVLLVITSPALAGSNPPLPVPAAGAGYTTLAFHLDFTSRWAANTAHWLDCAGATNPKLFIAGFDQSSTPPCERISIVDDGGTQAMRMRLDVGDDAARALTLSTVNIRSGLDRGIDFPNSAYYRVTFRVPKESFDNLPPGVATFGWWTWSDTAAENSSWPEFDIFELGGPAPFGTNVGKPDGYGTDDSCIHTWGDNGPGACWSGWGDYYDLNQTEYHTLGGLITQNAATGLIAMCTYIDDVEQLHPDGSIKCGIVNATSSELNSRNYPNLTVGLMPPGADPLMNPIDVLITDVQIWTCENWRGPLATPGHECPDI
jgi:hypothetical protein